jgi:hypothetical protein
LRYGWSRLGRFDVPTNGAQTMTRMSDLAAARGATLSRKYLQSWRGSPLARTVHNLAVAMPGRFWIVAMTLTGCVIPPSLSIGEDAGVNSPPAIQSVTSERQVLPEPGPLVFDQGTMDTLSISMIDTDTLDTLYVGIYVDYNAPNRLAARSKCTAPSGTSPMRTTTCRLNSLCIDADIGVQRNMTIVVFDRPPDDTGGGDPPFQAMMAKDGLSTSRFYFLKCQPAQSP